MAIKNRFSAIIIGILTSLSLCAYSDNMVKKEKMATDGIIRLSKIEVYPQYLDEYMEFASEVGTTSLRTEPGVLTMYALQSKENPYMITI